MEKVKAKKQYGQNFLKDSTILDKIIQSMPNNNNHIVEIGPGLGDLTKNLVKYKDLTAYEVDTDLIGILKSKFAIEIEKGNLKLIHTDVLEAWEKLKNLHDGKYDLIANLPYYIATNIILRAFEDELCEHIIVMVQKEVAEKFTAKTNDKEYSSLGIITELISINSKILFDVPAEAFDPPPKVTSSILYIKKDMSKSLDKDFNKFLKACFIQPRKKLSKNLTTIFDKNIIFEIYKELNINDNVRPHEVSSSLYSQMYTKVKNGRNK
ncbi:16S rRNA (adenine(1518)-N(6)/adenine(1519)-N(6))-dimethyltransferase RsmA [Aliarcobacter butzleri]|uniref:16S rRNA (adenine(1518)-N(6)/adenine(1519)-N(6))- dimethyltransferase RsmA n=2 Tax=Aliarcobacter butzleri TaxID=28197 RepID=UPI0021B3B004|nr:16S rRNA (adenine(1518)-N(6)/adenine(1519)-N(6))-dimethyltransferase RsmA [Aliarcobacter butzleri]MCT7574037.1 16S rRNA (adenine(1518)-N(6)/adenine(1519)-N(6))-dimethyltransferase RsmA [Aliarcobacter butzleri]MCT7578832.1 16S rRNA (adenine(1518)-N(6)/adenine(1519)-N(6))-dimethyltransferase RsmA [Aliarcobacter butzleri]MCT7611617.1 16S rRNA (adenine(1518)-N(6)/adenine(1519)-N(6))-dimethyltransferase RsmA [Aliarcobacter butzleri]MCT7640420.1 16S rRNA (adenine(1518)-N(6)/adenine(1519)-N(6))-dim